FSHFIDPRNRFRSPSASSAASVIFPSAASAAVAHSSGVPLLLEIGKGELRVRTIKQQLPVVDMVREESHWVALIHLVVAAVAVQVERIPGKADRVSLEEAVQDR